MQIYENSQGLRADNLTVSRCDLMRINKLLSLEARMTHVGVTQYLTLHLSVFEVALSPIIAFIRLTQTTKQLKDTANQACVWLLSDS